MNCKCGACYECRQTAYRDRQNKWRLETYHAEKGETVRSSPWSAELTEKVHRLYLDGFTAGDISRLCDGKISRNAVLGKAHRSGWCNTRGPAKPKVARVKPAKIAQTVTVTKRSTQADKIKAALTFDDVLKRMESAPDKVGKSLLDLEPGDCKWPIGAIGEPGFGFCADRAASGLPYCPKHCARAYRVPDMHPKFVARPVFQPAGGQTASVEGMGSQNHQTPASDQILEPAE